jgi:hypothetical protein
MTIALAIEIGAAILVTWLTRKAANGSLPRNNLAGVRTRITMSSDAAWQEGHRAALRPTVNGAAITVMWCLVSIAVPPLRTPVSVLVAAVALVVGTLLSVPAANRAARRASADARS